MRGQDIFFYGEMWKVLSKIIRYPLSGALIHFMMAILERH